MATTIGRLLPGNDLLERLVTDPLGRIRALVAATRATEVDDIALAGCVTAGSVIVPVALVLAAEREADAAALHEAIVAGYEAMIGFASAIDGANILYRGIWPTLAAAPIGAAAVAARLAGLNATKTAGALALAIGRSAWWTHRGLPRWLQLGHAAVDGVLAAQAAAAGFRASPDVLEGWAAAAGVTVDAGWMVAERRHIHLAESKTFPTARQALGAVQAFARLHAAQPVAPDDRIRVLLPNAYARMVGGTAMPEERIGSMLSAAYQMALIVHAPDRLYDVRRTPPLNNAALAAFLARVTIDVDPALDAPYPAQWGGRVVIGDREATVMQPDGGTAHPFGMDQLAGKANALAAANDLAPERFVALRAAVMDDARPADLLALITA